jgi:hypothetical protein
MYFKFIIAPMLGILSSNGHGKLEHHLWYSGSIDSRSRMSTGLAENLPIEGSSEAPIKGTTTVAQR